MFFARRDATRRAQDGIHDDLTITWSLHQRINLGVIVLQTTSSTSTTRAACLLLRSTKKDMVASVRQSYLGPSSSGGPRASFAPAGRTTYYDDAAGGYSDELQGGGGGYQSQAAPGASDFSGYVNGAQLTSISSCINAIAYACDHLEETNRYVHSMVAPQQRLLPALRNKRHFDLVSEAEIRKARDHLSAEIRPQLDELIDKAREALEREERKMKTLRNKVSAPRPVGQVIPSRMVCHGLLTHKIASAVRTRTHTQTLQQQAQLDEMGIKLDSGKDASSAAAPTSREAQAAEAAANKAAQLSQRAAERELELLKKQVGTLRRKRELFTREVNRLEEEVDRASVRGQ